MKNTNIYSATTRKKKSKTTKIFTSSGTTAKKSRPSGVKKSTTAYLILATTRKSKLLFITPRGDYKWTLNDHIAYRYEIVEMLGKGSFGQVFKVFDHKRNDFAALKIIRNKKKFYNQALVEVKLLKFIRDNDFD